MIPPTDFLATRRDRARRLSNRVKKYAIAGHASLRQVLILRSMGKILVFTGLAAAAGAFCRIGVYRICVLQNLPVFWATLSVNSLGSFALGFCMIFTSSRVPFLQGVVGPVGAGFLGAFTTFSAFSKDLFELLATRHYGLLLVAAMQVPLGLVLYFMGIKLAQWLVAAPA